MLDDLRSGAWLTARRLRHYPTLFLAMWLTAAVGWVLASDGIVDPSGRPLGTDFASFWSTSTVLLEGRPLAAYDDAALRDIQRSLAGRDGPHYTMLYPPMGLLIVLPLALAAYPLALTAWLLGTFAAYLAVLWRAWPLPSVLLMGAAFPAVFVTVGHGQNAFLSAALLGGAMLALPGRPVLAGLLIGLLSYKPHLGLVIPFALAAGGHWRAFAAAAAAAAALALAATLAFGAEIWPAYLARTDFARQVLEQGLVDHGKMQSLFAAARLWGAGTGPAYTLQWGLAAAAAVALMLLWRTAAPHALKAAALMTAAVLVTPFVFDYDLTLLALPLLLLTRDGVERGFLPWEKTVLAAVWAVPLLARPAAMHLELPLGLAAILVLYAIILRRAYRLPNSRSISASLSST